MAKKSYQYTEGKVQGVLKHLTDDDRQLVVAYYEDRIDKATQGQPTYWALLGMFFAGPVAIACFLIAQSGLVTPDCPEPVVQTCPEPPACHVCEVCETCPEPPTLKWEAVPYHPMNYTRVPGTGTMCYWPRGEDIYFCIEADHEPTTETLLPALPETLTAP